MNCKNIRSIYQLRFILQQPSIYWKDFGIDEIKLKIANPVTVLFKLVKFKYKY